MYQFYYADPAKSFDRIPCKEDLREQFEILAVRPTMWEEHCLECAAPDCFGSCVHYEARSDGRCKRFENGLQVFADPKACCGQGAHVRFRKWGNMMTVLFPAMLTEEGYTAMTQKNQGLGRLLGAVEGSPLPRALRWQGIRIPEYLRRKNLRGLKGLDNRADAFLFQGYSYHPEPYRLMVEVYDDHTPVFKTALDIRPGENTAILTELSAACSQAGNLVKVYPEKDLEAELDILWCDFVQGSPILRKPAPKVKCLVWDLDNTLWDGTLIETGDPDSLALRPGVLEALQELDRRGILLSIASKNDPVAVRPVLDRLGVRDLFLHPQIHWHPKSGSMENIARALNIGLDTLALIDDTAFEREQVRGVLPQVRTYDVTDLETLLSRPEFDVPVTDESRTRRALYRTEALRTQVRQEASGDLTDFLRRSHIRGELFEPVTEAECRRCYELVVRTNQLNMTGLKYAEKEFSAVMRRVGHRNFALSCGDDFGAYGIVAFGQYRISGEKLIFTEFAMSCRAAGKWVESALFAHLLEREGCAEGVFPLVKTKKNTLLRDTLAAAGFTVRTEDDSRITYRFTPQLENRDILNLKERAHEA